MIFTHGIWMARWFNFYHRMDNSRWKGTRKKDKYGNSLGAKHVFLWYIINSLSIGFCFYYFSTISLLGMMPYSSYLYVLLLYFSYTSYHILNSFYNVFLQYFSHTLWHIPLSFMMFQFLKNLNHTNINAPSFMRTLLLSRFELDYY